MVNQNYVLTQEKLYCEHDEAAQIIPLALIIWMKQLPPCTEVCKTQIALMFWNIFEAARLSCYVIVTMKVLELTY